MAVFAATVALADVRWADSPAFGVNTIPLVGGLTWNDSPPLELDVTLVSRASADSNSFGIDAPAPPPDQPAPGQSVPVIEVDLARLRVWDTSLGRFVNPPGAISINLAQPTYLLTHGWDDTLGPQSVDGCPPQTLDYGMSTIAAAIADALDSDNDGVPEANILGWEWGDCLRGSNPNCLLDIDLSFWDLVATFGGGGPGYLALRAFGALLDASLSDFNAGRKGNELARALVAALPDPDQPSLGSALHFIGHSHGGGLLARAAEGLHDRGLMVDTLTMLDTPRWGAIDTMDLLETPSKIGHVAIYYGDGDLATGAFGAPYDGTPPNVTSIRLNPDHLETWLHSAVKGDDYEGACGSPYGSWFGDAVSGGILFMQTFGREADDRGFPIPSVLDPRTLPAGRFHEGTEVRQFWAVGACQVSPTVCIETDEQDCEVNLGGTFQGAGTYCQNVYERARAGTPPPPDFGGLRLLWFNGMETAADWTGTGAVVASGSDPANPANVVVRLVDVGTASFFREFAWPGDTFVFQFDYMFDAFAVAETLTVYVGNEIIYYDAADVSLARGGLRSSGPIAVRSFAGMTGQLNFVLRGDGELGGMCLIDNLAILALPAGDVDFDGDIDIDDALRLVNVMNGPGVLEPPPGGSLADFEAADFDEDGDVDLGDFALMQQALR